MEGNQYTEIFRSLGIQARPVGSSYPMRYGGQSIHLYFISNLDIGVYFSARLADEHLYPRSLWCHIDPLLVKKKDRPESQWRRLPVRPREGREAEAFRRLLEDRGVHL